ncbi:hypothetical protein [Streptomyces sp. NPDC018055]|uniref:hypothetical protein n=1 Tax=Streptomyces sp. NPDC018055 TaxID=3365038 RepID=UPI0037BC8CB8
MLLNLSADSSYGKAAVQTVTIPTAAPARIYAAPGGMPHEVIQVPPPTVRVSMAATDLLDSPADWNARQLQDYVERAVAERHGPQPTGNEAKHAAIFQSFHKRWGNLAGPIARFAFEQQDGFWHSAPVTALRFTKGSDEYFARPISERLTS